MLARPRSILITGASTGIGYHAAVSLAQRGWTVIGTARKRPDLDRLKQEGIRPIELDYTDEASINAGFAEALDHCDGRIDALFNNGAYGQTGALEDISTDDLRAQFEANFFGWHTLTRKLIPVMRTQGSGRIVQCSSVLGFVAAPFRGPYQASKFALEAYTDTLRGELAPFGIKVISIQPGPITSKFRETALATFERTVDHQSSAYADIYRRHLKRLRSPEKAKFELGPEAVTAALVRALEEPNPKPAYRVTFPTKAVWFLKRVLPTRQLHKLLNKQD